MIICWIGCVMDRMMQAPYRGTRSKYTAVVGLCRHTVASTTVIRLIAAADVMPVALLEEGVGVEVGECLCVARTACVASTHICTST